jgi:GntR family transcriptional regulator, rspAB operon transcriptional repressor
MTATTSSLTSRARDELRQRLLDRRLQPGQWIERRSLARELQMSLIPVGQAVVQLEAEGFLESVPRRGTRVRPRTLEEVAGHYLVREALECQAARLYCGAPVRGHEPVLLKLARRVDAAELRTPALIEADVALHRELVKLTGVAVLIEAFLRVADLNHFFSVSEMIPADRPNERRPRGNHVKLIKSLQRAQPDDAERLMREHLRTGKQELLQAVLPMGRG